MKFDELRKNLAEMSSTLEWKEREIWETFDGEQLNLYFKSRDSICLLIPTLLELEKALYAHKILV